MYDLKHALYDAISSNVLESKIAVAFSGGVDSSLLAKICHDLGKQMILVTIGFPGSHDIGFATAIASKMGMKCRTLEIDFDDFQEKMRQIQETIKCKNTSHIENCIGYFYVCKLAKQFNFKVILSANGCDELFCGYDGYRRAYKGGEPAIMKLMEEKIVNELALVEEITMVAEQFGVVVRQPFLSNAFIKFAKTIPLNQKIKGSDDMTRKHILRQEALSLGVPVEAAMKPKKALQYGTLIHKHFKKMI